jgi:hypothetical protein
MPTPHEQPAERVPVVEILHEAKETIEKGESMNRLVKVYAGKNAFRIYQASRGVIGKNRIGNLQGMVKSAKARTIFQVTSEIGEKLEILSFLAVFAQNIADAGPEFEAIWDSKDSPARKYVHLTQLADKIGKRTATGMFTAGVSTIYDALKGWCLIGSLAGGAVGNAANQCVSVLQDADFRVKAAGKAIADFASEQNPVLNTIEIIVH